MKEFGQKFHIQKYILLIGFLLSLSIVTNAQNNFFSQNSGKWDANKFAERAWNYSGCGTLGIPRNDPGANDNASICEETVIYLEKTTSIANLTIHTGGVLDIKNNINLTVTGTLILDGSIIVQTGTLTLADGARIEGGGVFTSSGSGHVVIEDNVSIDGTNLRILNSSTNTALSIAADATVSNDQRLTIQGDVFGGNASSSFINNTNSELSIDGTLLATGKFTASALGNSVTYNSTSDQDIKTTTDSTYHNLITAGSGIKSTQSSLFLNGDLIINSGTLNLDTDTLTLKGNWQNNGTFAYGTSHVIFNDTTDQEISAFSNETFYDLTIDKDSGNLILNNDIEIRDTLHMINGIIHAQENTLTLGYDATNTGTLNWNTGYIAGHFERWLNHSNHDGIEVLFPIGNQDYQRDFKATYTFSGIGGGSLTVCFNDNTPGNAGLSLSDNGTAVHNTFVDGYWETTDNGLLDLVSTYDLSLNGEGFKSFTFGNVRTRLLSRLDNASNWLAIGTHVNSTGSIANREGITTTPKYTEYCFADTGNCSPPAPITITGNFNVYTGDTLSYIAEGASDSEYTWSFANDAGVIISQSNNTADIAWGANGMVETILVQERNTCTYGPPATLQVNVHSIAPTQISGNAAVPVSQSGEVYTAVMNDYTDYTFTWSVDGGTIAADPMDPGDKDETITVDWDSNAGNGKITVTSSYKNHTASNIAELEVLKYEVIRSISSGNWDDYDELDIDLGFFGTITLVTTNWNCACIPGPTDNVIIEHDIVADNPNITINNVTIEASASLDINKPGFNITGNLLNHGSLTGSNDILLSGVDTYLGGVGTINNSGLILSTGNKIIEPTTHLTINGSDVTLESGIQVINNSYIELIDAALEGTDAASTWINAENSTLVSNTAILSTGTLTAGADNNTVHYSGTGAQNIITPTNNEYYNLVFEGTGTKTQAANLDLLGDLTINTGATYNPANFDINLSGDWVNNGSFTTGTSSITLNGTEEQSITNPLSESFYELTINKASEDVLLVNNLNVLNNLSMLNGNVDTTSFDNLITLGSPGTEGTLNHTSGTIVGQFKRYITSSGTKLFPIGTDTSYNALSMGIGTVNANGSLTALFNPSDPGNTGIPLYEDALEVNAQLTDGYWSATAGDLLDVSGYSLTAIADGFLSLPIISATRIITREYNDPANAWSLEGLHTNASGDTIYRTGLNNLTAGTSYEFGLGNTDCATFIPPTIIGSVDLCAGETNVVYTVPDRGNTYLWSVEKGVETSGQGSNEITVDWQANPDVLAYVKVIESSTCYDAPESELEVTLHSLPTSSITGPANIFDQSIDWDYSVTARPGYTYTWSIDSLGVIASGQNSANITIDYDSIAWPVGVDERTTVIRVLGQKAGCSAAMEVRDTLTVFKSYFTKAAGSWSNPATWEGGVVPNEGDNVKIKHNVNLAAGDITNNSLMNLFIESGNTLEQTTAFDLEVLENYKNDGIHNLNLGNLSFNGTETGLSFTGTGAITNGGTINFNNNYNITASSNLSITGNVSLGNVLINNDGIVSIIGDITSSTSGFWNNNQNATLKLGGNVAAFNGTLFATALNNTVEYNGGAQTILNPGSSKYYNLSITTTGRKSLNNNLTISGDLTINNGSLSAGTNTLSVFGDWINNGDFEEGTGTVVFKGTSNQSISNGGEETFYNLNLTSANGIQLTLNNNIRITNHINLYGSYLNTKEFELIINDNATCNGGEMDSFVDGPVRKIGDDNFLFPVGAGTVWAPIEMTNVSGELSSDEFVAQYFYAPPLNQDQLGTGLDHISSVEYWDLTKANGNAIKDVTLHWKNAQRSYIEDLPDLRVAHYNLAVGVEAWEDYGGTATGATGAGSVGSITAPDVSSFSPFTFASANGVNALPIELLNFTGKASNNAIDLFWTTATEINNDYFEIQHSVDGINFYTIGKEFGSGNSSVEIDYTFSHYTPSAGINYYRLKQFDYDGAFEIHKIIAVEYLADEELENDLNFKLYPNPLSAGDLNMGITQISSPQMADVMVSDLSGNVIVMKKIQLHSQETVSIVPRMINGLQPGMYMVSIITHKQKITNKLIVN